MYLGIDIGGTKTLVAALNEHGEMLVSLKFATPEGYDDFLDALKHVLRDEMPIQDFRAGRPPRRRACGTGLSGAAAGACRAGPSHCQHLVIDPAVSRLFTSGR